MGSKSWNSISNHPRGAAGVLPRKTNPLPSPLQSSRKKTSKQVQQYFPASLEAGAGRAGDKKEDMGVDVPSVAESCSSESSAGEESDEEEVSDEESDEEEASESDASMQEENDGAQRLEELSDDDGDDEDMPPAAQRVPSILANMQAARRNGFREMNATQ